MKILGLAALTALMLSALAMAAAQDKKAEGGRLTFILARSAGDTFVARDVDPAEMRAFLISEGAV